MSSVLPSPRLVRVDLGLLQQGQGQRLETTNFRAPDSALQTIAAWSGPALALAALVAEVRTGKRGGAFLIAVGDGVGRGLPTAARASLIGFSPLHQRWVQAQVGGDLAQALFVHTDVLWLEGRASGEGQVLLLAADGELSLCSWPELSGQSPQAVHEFLRRELGNWTSLRVGAAGEALLPYANLAAGGDPQSFVGRGGLGAAFAQFGLKAFAVQVGLQPADSTGLRTQVELLQRLSQSPRLLERKGGGSLELAAALAARGAWNGADTRQEASAAAEEFSKAARATRRGTHGCRGCPTPCGYVFEQQSHTRSAGRFAALNPLGSRLGLNALPDSLALLGRCDLHGLDAKEVGHLLTLLERARASGQLPGSSSHGDLGALLADIDGFLDCNDERSRWLQAGVSGRLHSANLAEPMLSLGVEPGREHDYALLLGTCAGVRGAEPMRSFPFSTSAGASDDYWQRVLAPLDVPAQAFDPLQTSAKGRLVWWHENFAAAVDATGFCAFSAAALLCDGLATLDELALWIAPFAVAPHWQSSPSRAFLAAGASLVLLQAELDESAGFRAAAGSLTLRALLAEPGMQPEYELMRGIADGKVQSAARALLASTALLSYGESQLERPSELPARPAQPTENSRLGVVRLQAVGILAEHLGGVRELHLALPAPLSVVLHSAAAAFPEASAWLLRGEQILPAVYLGGRRLSATTLVQAGARLDLVLVIAGG